NVTNDMLIAFKASIDKHIWMFKAFLGKAPLE
ncbi:DNA starvation/stationary phase protection protein, partial [Escherichia coli]|nr:DNA starvation/stationary phase protection protein [Escherichia coli]